MQIIMDAKINNYPAPLLRTKALIVNVIGKRKVNTSAMTKAMWDSIIENIVIEGKEKAVIHFKTGMAQEMAAAVLMCESAKFYSESVGK